MLAAPPKTLEVDAADAGFGAKRLLAGADVDGGFWVPGVVAVEALLGKLKVGAFEVSSALVAGVAKLAG